METLLTLMIPAMLGILTVRLLAMPIGWILKAALHGISGLLCLLILNTVSGFTGVFFPVNAITVSMAGFLGIPGIFLLTLLEILF